MVINQEDHASLVRTIWKSAHSQSRTGFQKVRALFAPVNGIREKRDKVRFIQHSSRVDRPRPSCRSFQYNLIAFLKINCPSFQLISLVHFVLLFFVLMNVPAILHDKSNGYVASEHPFGDSRHLFFFF